MAHEKAHVICENLCLEEGMTKQQIEDYVKETCVVKDKFAFIETRLTASYKSINYPTGFNMNNCVVVSVMLKTLSSNTSWDSAVIVNNGNVVTEAPANVSLFSNEIRLSGSNRNQDYKIVLMRVD